MSIRLDLIGIVTRDMAESHRFYRALGLEIPENAGEDHFEITLPNGLRLAWDTVELMTQVLGHWEPPMGHRLGLAFLCEGPSGVDETYRRIVDAGFKGAKEPWDAFWGQRYAMVEDPDGNAIDLFAPLNSQ
jgi:catechol 2,3-dioxygenase-like lactoylglutathione lyase family enzyme